MGFNLDMFFEDLEQAFKGKINTVKRLKLIYKIIIKAKAYAKECDQLRD